MKLLKTVLLLALHGAHASTRHKATKNAVDAETIPICMHGWEPIWEAVGGTCEGDCDFFPEPEDIDYEGNSRRNLRFGITGGGGCCIPWFAPGYLY